MYPDPDFQSAVEWLLSIEGGYVNAAADPGGETHFGISKRSYPQLDIRELTEAQAWTIYYNDYWIKAGCHRLPLPLAWALFDGAVQHGILRATIMLQGELGGLRIDGINGPKTQAAAEQSDTADVLVRGPPGQALSRSGDRQLIPCPLSHRLAEAPVLAAAGYSRILPGRSQMKRFANLLFTIALVIAAGGCNQQTAAQYAVNTTRVAASLVQLDQAIDPAIETLQQRIKRYTEDEQTQLTLLYAELSELRHTVQSMIRDAGGMGQFLIAASEMQRFYTVAKAKYIEAKTIIAPHLGELSTSERLQVAEMDDMAQRLDRSLEALLTAPDGSDISQALSDLLAVSASVARVVSLR